jgi:hypothetical protein
MKRAQYFNKLDEGFYEGANRSGHGNFGYGGNQRFRRHLDHSGTVEEQGMEEDLLAEEGIAVVRDKLLRDLKGIL